MQEPLWKEVGLGQGTALDSWVWGKGKCPRGWGGALVKNKSNQNGGRAGSSHLKKIKVPWHPKASPTPRSSTDACPTWDLSHVVPIL